MSAYSKLDFYHDRYTLVDKFQWKKLHTKYEGGPVIKWWQETDFLQRFKPADSELQQLQQSQRKRKTERKRKAGEAFDEQSEAATPKMTPVAVTASTQQELPTELDLTQQDEDSLDCGAQSDSQATNVDDRMAADTVEHGEGEGTHAAAAGGPDNGGGDGDDDGLAKFEVCKACNAAREQEELREQLQFSDKTLFVKHVAKITEPAASDGVQTNEADSGRRKSRRSRAGKAYQTYTVLVSSVDTLLQVKMKVSTSLAKRIS